MKVRGEGNARIESQQENQLLATTPNRCSLKNLWLLPEAPTIVHRHFQTGGAPRHLCCSSSTRGCDLPSLGL